MKCDIPIWEWDALPPRPLQAWRMVTAIHYPYAIYGGELPNRFTLVDEVQTLEFSLDADRVMDENEVQQAAENGTLQLIRPGMPGGTYQASLRV